ncbi:MAG: mandelate racemase/muconate lactonizing enzyme family protein [Salinirussus sp.]
MAITGVTAYPLRAPIDEPVWTAQERWDTDALVLVEIETDAGVTGFGEARGAPQDRICEYVEIFGEALLGRDHMARRDCAAAMLRATRPRPGGLGDWDELPGPLPRRERREAMTAMAGIDIALWDIAGKAVDEPVYRVLGGTDEPVFCYATGGFYDPDDPAAGVADELGGFVDDGFDAVKMKAGALSLEDERARIREVRDAIGPEPDLLLDVNAPFGVEECIEFATEVAEYDIGWLEEPLYWYLQPRDFSRAADRSPVPLAHGEREFHRFTTRDFIESGAIRYVQFDATRFAGFTEAIHIAEYAAQENVRIAPHAAPHIHAHLVAAFTADSYGAEVIGADGFRPITETLYGGGPTLVDGRLELPDAPGFGLDVNRDAIETFEAS